MSTFFVLMQLDPGLKYRPGRGDDDTIDLNKKEII